MEKRCNKCGQSKPLTEFYKAPGGRDGHRNDCKTCNLAAKAARYRADPQAEIKRVQAWQQANRERYNAWQREYRKRRRREMREGHLRRTFGIVQAEYDAMLAAQGGGCAICGDEPVEDRSFHVDHLGEQVRGILCVRCNNALGQLKEREDLANRAGDYLSSGGFVPSDVYELLQLATDRARALRAA